MHDIVITNFGEGCLEDPDDMLTTSGVADLTDCPLSEVDVMDMYDSILQYCEKQASDEKVHPYSSSFLVYLRVTIFCHIIIKPKFY
jgi:hypothetical protein